MPYDIIINRGIRLFLNGLVVFCSRSSTTNFRPQKLIHHRSHTMDVLITDLHEDRPALREQFPRHRQPIAQIREIGVDPVLPGVAERLDLFGLAETSAACRPSRRGRVVDTCQLELNLMP